MLRLMYKKIVIGILIILLAVPLLAYYFKTKISVHGSRITIDAGPHHIEGFLGPEKTFRLLLKDRGISINTFSGDALVAVMPFEKAEELRAQYGDFFRCGEPGAEQAIQGMELTVLVANDGYTKEKIAEAMALVEKARIPVVTLSGSHILIGKNSYFKMNVKDDTGTSFYFIKAFSISKPSYL